MIGGIAVVKDDDLAEQLQFIQNAAGAVPGPFDAGSRCAERRRCTSACARTTRTAARSPTWLAERVGDERVIYPGLPSHPQHALAKRQMSGFGGMICVDMGTKERAARCWSASGSSRSPSRSAASNR